MDEAYSIDYLDKPAWEIIRPGITHFNEQKAGDDKAQNLYFVLRGPDGIIVGGVMGATYWDWFYLDLMWIREDLRGRGYGQRLLMLAEEEARQRSAKNVYLDTFCFKAPDFYKDLATRSFVSFPISLLGINAAFLPNSPRNRVA